MPVLVAFRGTESATFVELSTQLRVVNATPTSFVAGVKDSASISAVQGI